MMRRPISQRGTAAAIWRPRRVPDRRRCRCAAGASVRASSAPRARRPAGPYSPGVLVGKTLYISGHLGLPGDGADARRHDAQTRQAMDGDRRAC